MPDFPIAYSPGFAEIVTTGAPVLTAHASAHTKGVYTELIASTAYDCDGLLCMTCGSAASVGAMVDVAVGAAGSEIVIFPNFLVGSTGRVVQWFHIPVSVPAGSRIAARCQGVTGGTAVTIQAHVIRRGGWHTPSGGRIEALGANTATTRGKVIDPGAVLNTLGAWAELSAATAQDISAVHLFLGNGGNTAPTDLSTNGFRVQLGIGAAGSEVLALGSLGFGSSSTGAYGPLPLFWFPLSIPAGSRVAARALANTTDATDRLFDLVAYGLVI